MTGAELVTAVLALWPVMSGHNRECIEARRARIAQQVEAFDPDIARYADYALTGQGKHLRAALVALVVALI